MHRVSVVIPRAQRGGNSAARPAADLAGVHEVILVDGKSTDGTAALATDEALLALVSIVIPTLNEVECIGQVLARIPSTVREVIVVDGLSTDGTAKVALAARPDVRLVHQTVRGKGAAIRSGVEAASGEYIVLMDADGSTDPVYILTFARVLAAGADYVKASRFLPGSGTDDMPFHRRMGNWLFVQVARLLYGTHFTDITYGYNAVRRNRRGAMALEIDGWAQEIITNIRMVRYGMRVEEVPAFEPQRIAGVAKLGTWSAGWAILRAILAERRHPLSRLEVTAHPPVAVKVHGAGTFAPALLELSDLTPSRLTRVLAESDSLDDL